MKFWPTKNLPILTPMSELKNTVQFCTLFVTFFSIFQLFVHFFLFLLKKFAFFSRFQLSAIAAKNRTKCASTHRKNLEKIKIFLPL
jgi:hypothetical protein